MNPRRQGAEWCSIRKDHRQDAISIDSCSKAASSAFLDPLSIVDSRNAPGIPLGGLSKRLHAHKLIKAWGLGSTRTRLSPT